MIIVNIWRSLRLQSFGHVSLQMDCDNTYISWFPQEGTGFNRLDSIFTAHPIKNPTLFDEIKKERRFPEHLVYLQGLDELEIRKWWATFGLVKDGVEITGPSLPYHFLKQNCSTVVAKALFVGGGGKFAPNWIKKKTIWKPRDVFEFATDIQKGLRSVAHQK